MGASVAPELDPLTALRARDPLAALRTSDPLSALRSLGPRDTGDIVLPETPGDKATSGDRKPGLLSRVGTAVAETASDLYHHPSHLLTEPVKAGFDALFTPVEGSESSGIGGRGGRASLPAGTKITTANTPGAITPERQTQAGVESLVNAAAPGAAGKLGQLIAPKVGEVAGEVLGRVGANAAAGAATNPSDPIVGAASGVTSGEALHHTLERGVRAAVTERRATPRGNAPVWTPEQRDAYHAQQMGDYQSFDRVSRPAHPDAMQEVFDQGKSTPFPYQTVASLNGADDAGLQYRNSGPSLNPSQVDKVKDALGATFHAAADQVRRANPDLAAAGERAIASKANATHIGQVQTKWVTEGIDPKLADAFLPQLQLDRLNHLANRDPGLMHDPAFAKNLSDLQAQVPEGFTETPEFRQMADRYKTGILSQTESAAASAGLKPEQFADLPNGYARLVANRNAAPNTIAESVGGTGPRPNPSTRLTTAQKATGTSAYTNSLAETVTADAMDKVVKARANEFYQQLLKSGKVLEDPKAVVPKGYAKIMFDDRANVIDDPASAKITLQVPQNVADYAHHVWGELSRSDRPTSPAGRFAKTLDQAASTVALAVNPAAATTHISTLSNVLGSTPTPGAPLKALAGLVPGGKTAMGVVDWASLDRTEPKVRQLESDLSAQGGLRPETRAVDPTEANALQKLSIAAKKTGLKYADPHEWLFGENGVDKRVRLVLAQRFIDSETARTGQAPAMHDVAAFVNQKAGNYIAGNAGSLVNALQRSKASLFARMATARLSNAGKMLTGNTGMPGKLNRAQGIALGAPGALVGIEVLNHLLSGHGVEQNQPGHHTDIQYGTDSEGRPEYIKGNFFDPLTSAAMNRTGISSLLFDKSLRGAARDVENTALSVGTSHPLTRAAFGAGLGKEPYVTSSGDLKSVGHPSLDQGQGELKSRVGATVSGLTSVGQAIQGTTGGNESMSPALGKTLRFFGPAITSLGSATDDPQAKDRQTVEKNWLDDRLSQIYRADPADRKQVAGQVMTELNASDYSNVVKAIAKKQIIRATVVPDAVRGRVSNVRRRPFAAPQ